MTSPRKLPLSVISALLFSLALPALAQAVIGNARVNADDLYVRTRWDSWMIGTLYRNQRFDIQGSSNGYYWGYADGAFNGCGWVGSAYVIRDNAGSPGPSCGAPRDLGDPHCGAGCYSATDNGDPWHVTCQDATVFGNYRSGDFRSPQGTIYSGQGYNWRYTTADRRAASIHWNGKSVFVLRSCVAPGAPQPPPPPPSSDGWFLRNSNSTGGADLAFTYGNPTGDLPLVGDWDRNGTDTPGVFRSGTWYLRNSNSSGGADIAFGYGNTSGDVPLTGDWNGDGIDTPGVFRSGTWYLRNSNSTGGADIAFGYGDPGDVPVVGDWDRNGTDTPGVFRSGTWFLRNSNSTGGGDIGFTYGNTTGDVPIAGDWNADGIDTPGVYR